MSQTLAKLPKIDLLQKKKSTVTQKIESFQSLFGDLDQLKLKNKSILSKPIRSITNDHRILESKMSMELQTSRIKMRSVHLKKSSNSPLYRHVYPQHMSTENEESVIYENMKYDELTRSKQRFHEPRQLIQSARECLSHRSKSPKWDQFNYAREDINIHQDPASPSEKKKEFFQCYKYYDRAQQIVETFSLHPNLYIKMLTKANEKNLFPKTLSLVKQTKSMHINVKRQLLGQQKYSNILLTALIFQPTPQELNLSENKLTPRTLHRILENGLKEGIQQINLTNNYITKLPNFQLQSLQVLILVSTGLTDDHIPELLTKIPPSLSVLDLSYNTLSDKTARHLGAYLIDNENILELYLRWNRITGLGGQIFFEALVDNSILKVLDLSYNSLGHPEEICIESLKNILLLPHPELLHFDISHNQFSPNDCEIIANCISGNQQIYGMHLIGNQDWFINAEGWAKQKQQKMEINNIIINQLLPIKKISSIKAVKSIKINLQNEKLQQIDPKHVDRRIQSVDFIGENKYQTPELDQFDNCWICDGWQEIKFEWIPIKSGEFETEPIYIHLDFLQYKPLSLEFYNKSFVIYKMCPPNRTIKYFFSNPNSLETAVQYDAPVMNVSDENFPTDLILEYENNLFLRCCKIDYVNYISTSVNSCVINKKQNYQIQVNCRPRGHFRHQDMIDYLNKLNGEWMLQNSLFRNFQADTIQLINECFEFDFNTSRIPKLCENEEYASVVKETIRPYYLSIFTAFKYYASSSQNIQFPCVPLSQFTEMLHHTKVLSSGGIRLTDIQVLFISSCSRESGLHDNFKYMADKAVVRFQFLEMIVRLAIDKYNKRGLMIDQCITKLMEEDRLIDQLRTFDISQDWRNSRYWNKECDEVLTKLMEPIKQIYTYAASFNLKTQNHRSKLLSYRDFHQLCDEAGLIQQTNLTDRDILQIYILSIATQINELMQLNHFLMSIIECMEGIARLAERLSPSIDRGKNLVQRRMQPLNEKLIILILIIYKQLKPGIKKLYHRKVLAYRDYERMIMNEIGRRQMNDGKTKQDLEAQRRKEIELKKKKILIKPFASKRIDAMARKDGHQRNSSQKNRVDSNKKLMFTVAQLLGLNTDEKKSKRILFGQKNPEVYEVMKQLKYFENNKN